VALSHERQREELVLSSSHPLDCRLSKKALSRLTREEHPKGRKRACQRLRDGLSGRPLFYFFDLESGCVGALRATSVVFVSNDDRRALFATPLRRHASILVEIQNSIALDGFCRFVDKALLLNK
jgi:hypothetical protein